MKNYLVSDYAGASLLTTTDPNISMRFLHITTILVLLANLAVAQVDSDNFSIKMYVSPMVRLNGGDFECTIQKRGNSLKLAYKYRDSVSRAYYQDKRARPLFESFISNRSARTMDSIRSLENEYSFYREDSLTVSASEHVPFVDLIKQIVTKPKEALEDLEADKKLTVADGATYSFQIQTSQRKMIVNSINLDSTLHPLLYRLTTEVMNIYKIEKHRDFFGEPLTSFFWKSDLIARTELNIIGINGNLK